MRDLEIYKPIYFNHVIKGDDKSFSNIIKKLRENKQYYKKWSNEAIELAKKYESLTVAKKIIQIYKEEILKDEKA
jgi:glycosyltransferase involved in cell wall biosynthesis